MNNKLIPKLFLSICKNSLKCSFISITHIFSFIHNSITKFTVIFFVMIYNKTMTMHHTKHSTILHHMFTHSLRTKHPITSTLHIFFCVRNMNYTCIFIKIHNIHKLNNSTLERRCFRLIHICKETTNTSAISTHAFSPSIKTKIFFSKSFTKNLGFTYCNVSNTTCYIKHHKFSRS